MTTPNLSTITSVVPKILSSSQLASGDSTIYTVAANKAAKISTLSLCNVSASPVVVSVALIPSGGSIDGTHRVVSGYTLQPGDTLPVEYLEGAWLGDGDKIVVSSGTSSAVDCVLTGLECS